MTTLNDFYRTNLVDDHVAADINELISASLRSEFKNVESLSATRTLLDADTPLQRLNCNGANRIVKMPTADATENHPFLLYNSTASGTYTLTVQNNGGTINHAVLNPSEFVFMLPDGNGTYVVLGRPFGTILTPSQITANQNDYNPTGAGSADVIRLSSDASRDITGLAFMVAGGKSVLLLNVGSNNIVLKDESASSTAANRFALNGDVTLGADQGVLVWYDPTSSRVRVIGGAGSSGTTINAIAGGRLTLTTGTPVTTSDVTGATTVYYSPFSGNQIALYDGSGSWSLVTFSELSLALGTVTSGLPYDIFIYNNAGVATMEKLAWTNGTTRATALTTQDGVLVKSGATTRRYIGTIYTSSTTQTEDSAQKRYVWNYYNRVPRLFYFTDTTNSWAYTTTSWRQWNNSAANQVDFVIGWSLDPVELAFTAVSYCTGIVNYTFGGIGLDRSTTDSDAKVNGLLFGPADTSIAGTAIYQGYPGVGKHYLAAMEYGRTSATFVGDDGGTTVKTGVTGTIYG